MKSTTCRLATAPLAILLGLASPVSSAEPPAGWVARFPLPESGMELSRHTEAGKFFDVAGRRSAVFGYENRSLEAWVYPLKVLHDFRLSFRLEGYPLDIDGAEIATGITVRPEATVFTYSHAAFAVRQVVFTPLDEPGIVMLLDARSVLPLTVTGSFRPRLRLMWPAGLMTGNLGWDEKERVYSLTEESKRFAAVIGCPGARDLSVMPYQEEPRDVPIRFEVQASPDALATHYLPIVIAGSVAGRDAAKAAYDRLLASARELYEKNVAHYRGLQERTLAVDTPDDRLDTAFAWAKVGVDKGLVANPLLGSGLVAGYRTSGESERPGFAWHFGRDALWTTFAIDAYGDFDLSRTALEFLRKFQRADGKIPHEISQSATLVPWLTDYKYPWEAADATPLYVVAQAEHWRASGDTAYLRTAWESIVKAWRFSEKTDSDGNGLIENTKVGHGWTEGSPPYPPHEEIYLQGIWIEACRRLAELAEVMGDGALAASARAAGERTRAAVEKTYWLPDRGFYAFATALPKPEKHYDAEPGPNRARRQARIEALRGRTLVDEDTVLPAVPLWWRTLDPERADVEIDRLGSAALATDWGHRLLSSASELYDPLSYHYGSVWGLFTGWASVGAYAYGRPHVGYQALRANAELTWQGALGYVTELLSGEFNTPFGRSSHHQVWSEAMVVTPVLRGLFGLEVTGGGKTLAFRPQLPASWNRSALRNVAAGEARYDITLERGEGRTEIRLEPRAGAGERLFVLSPAFPLDARVESVTVNGSEARFRLTREGDVQRAEVEVRGAGAQVVVFVHTAGTEVEPLVDAPEPGAPSRGLRVLRARATDALHLRLEGLAGRTYRLRLRTPAGPAELPVSFEGPPGTYVRRDVRVPLLPAGALAPQVDHHQHLFSPAISRLISTNPITADDLVALLDAAGIRRAVVLSVAYMFGSPNRTVEDEYAKVKAENDWTARQAERFPERLRAFCSVNPLRDYALEELARCAKDPHLRHGLKLHFGNSVVDYGNVEHVEQVRRVFRAANEHGMPILVHMRASISRKLPYGRAQARIFLEELLPAAPDVVVQIAHLAGAGGYEDPLVDEALAVFVDAIAKGDPRTKRLYFDVTGVVTLDTSPEGGKLAASRIRQLGVERVLYGSDAAAGGNPPPRLGWAAFRTLPLTEAEFATIANNVAPYLR